ncbi:MAG: HAMP domain-containing sensor histidine kinase [Caldilineaceae bacterium]
MDDAMEAKVAERTAALEVANSQLTALDEMKSEFIYNVSHELRNPITNLKLQLDLQRNNLNSPRRDRYIAAITKQVDLLAQLVSDMLDLIQLDKMHDQIEFSVIDLNTIVANVAEKLQRQVVTELVHFSVDASAEPLLIAGEQMQLCRAVEHLIRNAINYTKQGNINVCTFHRQGKACIQITDTGIGIAAEDLPYIRQRFYRGTNVSQSTIPGSGLGLSLVQEVAKVHEGGLEVESGLNQGSMFCLWFPVSEPVAMRAAQAR